MLIMTGHYGALPLTSQSLLGGTKARGVMGWLQRGCPESSKAVYHVAEKKNQTEMDRLVLGVIEYKYIITV